MTNKQLNKMRAVILKYKTGVIDSKKAMTIMQKVLFESNPKKAFDQAGSVLPYMRYVG